ncbi:MAG: hypothetical protein ACN4GW_15135, partial [Desulforhopalus sp.]
RLGELRGQELAHLIELYRPKLVLVDHTPQGKHRELVSAVQLSSTFDTRWILGVRGVVGEVRQSGSELARQLFSSHFHSLLWYGDSRVLGGSHIELLNQQYGCRAQECGYVLRLAEIDHWSRGDKPQGTRLAGTVSVPWLGENSIIFLAELAGTLRQLSPELGAWHLYIGTDCSSEAAEQVAHLFAGLGHCRIKRPGSEYVGSLLNSRVAVIYGGYNSLMDVMYAQVPAIVVLREMQDDEQRLHSLCLQQAARELISPVSESQVTGSELEQLLADKFAQGNGSGHHINMDGAPNAANYLESLLAEYKDAVETER